MNCPGCRNKLRCVDTRQPLPGLTRRIYFCASCDKKFYTSEVLDSGSGGGKEVAVVYDMTAESGADEDSEDDWGDEDDYDDEDEWADEDDWDAEYGDDDDFDGDDDDFDEADDDAGY